MRYVHGLFVLGLLLASPGYASKIQVIGTGEAIARPDQVSFSINIQSKCYPSVKEAAGSADKVTNELFTQLNKIFPKKDNNNQISTQGGYTQRFEPPRFNNKPVECKNTFQKMNSINILTSEVKNFEALFSQVQNLVYQSYGTDDDVLSKATTFVTMSEPTASLSFEQRRQTESLALQAALKNAVEKAKQLAGNENAATLKIVEIAESLPTNPPFRPMMMRAAAMEMGGAPAAPISFENSVTEKSLSVTFEY